jgi:ABC-type transport system involved in multi-copper enzyme maturation permease subunit
MTANTYAPGPQGRVSSLAGVPAKATFGTALRSEWTKIRTVRSTFWTLVLTMVITIGMSAAISAGAAGHDTTEMLQNEDLTQLAMVGLYFGQLVIVVFGALSITAEYGTGMIRTSLTSVPRRGTLLAAKAVVTTLVALVVGLVSTVTSFLLASAFYSNKHVHVSLSDPGVTRAVLGGALYLAATALLAFGLGAVLRHTAGAITSAVGLLFVATIVVNFLPSTWRDHVAKYLPANAGGGIIDSAPHSDALSPWTGFGVYLAYVAVALVLGTILIRRRDA